MKQTARIIRSFLLISLIIQLFSGGFGVSSVEARSLRLFNNNYSSLNDSTPYQSSLPKLTDEELDSESETPPGPPEPPESFPEQPEEPVPGSEGSSDESIESTLPPESSSQDQISQQPVESSSSSSASSTSNQQPIPKDETTSELNLMQIAPGSLMIKPANVVEPVNIASTVKHLVSKYNNLVLVSIKFGINLTQQLLLPKGVIVSQKISYPLISYFESLLNLIVRS